MPTISLLHDAHVLVFMSDPKTRSVMERLFVSLGATVHTAISQTESIGLYWRLFRAGIRPRIVVTSWWLSPKDSKEYKYLEMIDRVELDGTALNLFVNIVDLDPTAFLTVYTQDPGGAQEILGRAGITAEVIGRHESSIAEFVGRVATHTNVANQRLVCQDLSEQEQQRRLCRTSGEFAPAKSVHYG